MKRYVGKTLGACRPLTDEESAHLAALQEAAPGYPPWTVERKAAHAARDSEVLRLFEDGVACLDLAEALGCGVLGDGRPAVMKMLERARARGEGLGSRRYIAGGREPKPPRKRDLSPREVAELRAYYDALPSCGSGRRRWDSGLLALVGSLRADRVPLIAIADALGLTKQAIDNVLRYYAERAA